MTRNGPAILLAVLVAGGLAFGAAPVRSSPVVQGAKDFAGTGLGTVNTILAIQPPGRSTAETGSVSCNGSADVRSADTLNDASRTRTRPIAELGATSAAGLRGVFSALEPASAVLDSIRPDKLVLTIFSPTGSPLFSSAPFTPVFFADTFTGDGNSGFVFALDAVQVAAAQAAGIGFASDCIGLAASASRATGGFETFFVTSAPVLPVPEPAALGLLGPRSASVWAAPAWERSRSVGLTSRMRLRPALQRVAMRIGPLERSDEAGTGSSPPEDFAVQQGAGPRRSTTGGPRRSTGCNRGEQAL